MSKKDNFSKAVFDVFGVGASSEPTIEETVAEQTTAETTQELSTTAQTTAVAEPMQAAPYTLVPATFLAPGTVLEGTLSSRGDVELAGTFHGEINADGNVTLRSDAVCNVTAASLAVTGCQLKGDCAINGTVSISDNSVVTGNITADELFCSGSVIGDIVVKGALALEATARITGNISAGTMSMARGAVIQGTLHIERD